MEKPKNIQYHYFTFPIVLLKILHEDHRSFADNAICWTVYNYAETKLHGLPERERVEKALSKYGVSTEDLAGWIRHAKRIHRSIEGSKVMTSIEKRTLFDFLENDKSDAEVNELLAFAALRSVIGKKPYCKITDNYWLSRMAGGAWRVAGDDLASSYFSFSKRAVVSSSGSTPSSFSNSATHFS